MSDAIPFTANEQPFSAAAPEQPAPRPAASPEVYASDDPRPEIRRGMIAIGVFFAFFIVGGAITPLDAAVIGSGKVVVAGNRQSVQHRDGGIVAQLGVREGDEVKAGDVLLRIDVNELTSQERVLFRQTVSARMLEARLSAQLAGARTFERPEWMASLSPADLADAERTYTSQLTEFGAGAKAIGSQVAVLNERSAQARSQIAGLTGQIEATERQISLTREQLADIKKLYEQGHATLSRVRGLESSVADLEGRLISLTNDRERAGEVIAEHDGQRQQLRTGKADTFAEQLRQVQTELLTLEPRLFAVKAQIDRAEVRATASGRVVGLTIFTVGGVVSPGQVLMEIVPEQAPRVIEVMIRPQDAENIRVGQHAEVRFNIAHARRASTLDARVVNISADQFVDERTGAAFFKLQAEVPASEIENFERQLGVEASIGPGQPADVIVPVRGRSALGYLVDPLRDAMWRSFRED